MVKSRSLTKKIIEDLKNKMVFVGGPRQVGKTTLAKDLVSKGFPSKNYFNWDFKPDREKIMGYEFLGEKSLLIFDEIHKYRNWKNLIKGIYDTKKDKYNFLITCSARMNIYRKGGDSLQGRYHYYTLHPFSLAEITNIANTFEPFEELMIPGKSYENEFESLDKFGGFPEVFLKQNSRILRRWHNEKIERLFREEIRDVENVRDLGNMNLLADMLPRKVSSPLSINAIREELEVSHKAVSNWLMILENFYYHFRIYPFHKNETRAIKKEAKLYLTDWSEIPNESARFENLIASHLLKFTQYLTEYEGYKINLGYLKTKDKKEVDFLVSVNKKPWFAIEVKLSDTTPSKNLLYFKERLKIPFAYQVIKKTGIDFVKEGIRVISADRFLCGLV